MDLRFSITQTFCCKFCNTLWQHAVAIPFLQRNDDRNSYTNTVSLRDALTKAIYAANCVLFNGNIRLADLEVEESRLSSSISDYTNGQTIDLKCKQRLIERACPDCTYPGLTKPSAKFNHLNRDNKTRDSILSSLVIDSLPVIEFPLTKVIVEPPDNEAISDAKPLSENPPSSEDRSSQSGDSDVCQTITPIPAPRPSLAVHHNTSYGNNNNNNRVDLCGDPGTQKSLLTGIPDEEKYEIPSISYRGSNHTMTSSNRSSAPSNRPPPPPPVDPVDHVISFQPGIADVVRELLSTKGSGDFALVESPPCNTQGKYAMPFLLFCSALQQGYTPVHKTSEGRWFLSRGTLFNSMNELVTSYRHNPLWRGVILQHQITLSEWGTFNRHRMVPL